MFGSRERETKKINNIRIIDRMSKFKADDNINLEIIGTVYSMKVTHNDPVGRKIAIQLRYDTGKTAIRVYDYLGEEFKHVCLLNPQDNVLEQK